MKLIYLLFFAVLMCFSAYAETQDDSTKTKPKNEIVNKKPETGFPDSTLQHQKKKKDVFIDKDGDGICDNRANGMSFEKFRKRYRTGANKKDNPGHQGGRK